MGNHLDIHTSAYVVCAELDNGECFYLGFDFERSEYEWVASVFDAWLYGKIEELNRGISHGKDIAYPAIVRICGKLLHAEEDDSLPSVSF